MLLKKYTKENNIQELDILIAKSLEENFLSEVISEFDFDNEENRFFGDSVKIEHKVFQQPFIKFRNSKKIAISNSIVMNDLIFLSEDGPIEVFLDNCIISKELRFFGCNVNNIEINNCNISSIRYYNSEIKNCYISKCKVGKISIADSKIEQLDFFFNTINNIEKYHSNINQIQSTGDTIDLQRIIKGGNPRNIGLLDFVDTSVEVILDSIEDRIETRIETLHFLKDNNLLSQKNSLERLTDIELTCLSETSRLNKFLARCLSGFTKPSVFLIAGIVIILSFSFGYYKYGSIRIDERDCISFWESVYFSGVTFTTIGYGDIHPLGLTRIFTVVEGLLGIITCSGFLVSLVRKYTKSN